MKKIKRYFKESFMGSYLFSKCKTSTRKNEYKDLVKLSKSLFN